MRNQKRIPKIKIIKCPSGWYAIFIDNMLWDAASPTKKDALKLVKILKDRNGWR